MTAWEEIKQYCIAGKKKQSIGYLISLNRASELYMLLRGFIKDVEKEDEVFNADNELHEALMSKNKLEELSKLF